MPQVSRMYCSRCESSIFNTFIKPDGTRGAENDLDGSQRVPLVMYFVIGQPGDTGAAIDINAPGLCLPAFVREIMHDHVPLKRAELCMLCVADIFGTPCVDAVTDEMYSIEQSERTSRSVQAVTQDAGAGEVERAAATMDRVFQAIRVGRGAETAPPLPPVREPAAVAPAIIPTLGN